MVPAQSSELRFHWRQLAIFALHQETREFKQFVTQIHLNAACRTEPNHTLCRHSAQNVGVVWCEKKKSELYMWMKSGGFRSWFQGGIR